MTTDELAAYYAELHGQPCHTHLNPRDRLMRPGQYRRRPFRTRSLTGDEMTDEAEMRVMASGIMTCRPGNDGLTYTTRFPMSKPLTISQGVNMKAIADD